MAATPSQKETLEAILAEAILQTAEIAAQSLDIQTQTAAIVAMAADIAAQSANIALSASESTKAKNFAHWSAQYQAGANVELEAIEAGTHTFP